MNLLPVRSEMDFFANPSVIYGMLVIGVLLSMVCLLRTYSLAVLWFSKPGYTLIISMQLLFLNVLPYHLPMIFIHWSIAIYLLLKLTWQRPLFLISWMTCLHIFFQFFWITSPFIFMELLERICIGILLGCISWILNNAFWKLSYMKKTIVNLKFNLIKINSRINYLKKYVHRRNIVPVYLKNKLSLSAIDEASFLKFIDQKFKSRLVTSYHFLCLDLSSWQLLIQKRDDNSEYTKKNLEWQTLIPSKTIVATVQREFVVLAFSCNELNLHNFRKIIIRCLSRYHIGYRKNFINNCVGIASYPRDGVNSRDLIDISIQRLRIQKQHYWKKEIYRQRKLEKLSSIGQLAAGLAHEIRNPLTSIRGFLQIAALESVSIKKWEYIMLSEMDRINDLLKQFLKLSETRPISFSCFLLDQLMQDVLSLLRPKSFLMGYELISYPPSIPVEIQADIEQVKQVLINLIQNGLEALQGTKGRKVCIKWYAKYDKVIIKIEDDGNGIDKENLNRIFDPFFTTKREGTGMGLAVCQRIIEDHGGIIKVDSTLNKGTNFSIHLPMRHKSNTVRVSDSFLA